MVSLRSTLALGRGLAIIGPASASAAPDGSDTNRFRVHLGGELGSWVRQVPWPRSAEGPSGSRDDFGFIGFHRLQLSHAVENAPSCRVAEKAGYAAEGIMRSSLPAADGGWWDMELHATINPRH